MNEDIKYTDQQIETLEWNEHIRRRAGMYIGRLGSGDMQGDGIYVLLKEVIDNCVDEFSMGYGRNIIITIENEKEVSVRDFGRGIPLDSVVKVSSELNTGGKFNDKAFKKSVGLNGVGIKAVNALSTYFYIESFRDGVGSYAEYRDGGQLVASGKREAPKEKNGTFVKYIADNTLFPEYRYHEEFVKPLIKNYSYLKKGLTLILNGEQFVSNNGLLDLVAEGLHQEPLYPLIHLQTDDLEIVLTHSNSYGENIASFVNGQNTRDGGTHLAAFREAVARTVKEFYKKDYAPEDVRMGIIGAISIQIHEPNFEGQTKTKLGSTYLWEKATKAKDGSISTDRGPTIRTFVGDFVKKALDDYLHMHKETAMALQAKIVSSEDERKAANEARKKTREQSKGASIYNPKLRDCKIHLNEKAPKGMEELKEKTSIFITEGDSASGTINSARNGVTQAVFSLRGKPINCYKESRVSVAGNKELNLLINALGVEDDVSNLRYNNIIVATDADDDGMHIRMLVVTFFLTYYPELVRSGHVFILQTPLFRVKGKGEKNKGKVFYCYNQTEKEAAIKSLKGSCDITRFKGLGEISKDEFKGFIDDNIRLDEVKISAEESMKDLLEFYMGNNTPERLYFIEQNLRSEKELEDTDF